MPQHVCGGQKTLKWLYSTCTVFLALNSEDRYQLSPPAWYKNSSDSLPFSSNLCSVSTSLDVDFWVFPVAKESLGGTHTYPHALDACTGDLLAVVQLQSLQAPAVLQVLQRGVGDKKAVVQLQYPESLVPTGAAAQV